MSTETYECKKRLTNSINTHPLTSLTLIDQDDAAALLRKHQVEPLIVSLAADIKVPKP